MKIKKRNIFALIMAIVIAQGAFQFLRTAIMYSHLSTRVKFTVIEANEGQHRWDADDLEAYDEAFREKDNFIKDSPMARFLASFGDSTLKQLLRLLLIGLCPVVLFVCYVVCNYQATRIRTYLRRTKVRRRRYRQRRWRRWKRRLINLLFNNNI